MFPSAYCRVAGPQSEIGRVALTRVAGTKIECNKHLDTFKKHMCNRIASIKKQQDQLKKSAQEYSSILKKNRRERAERLQSDLAFDRRCLRLAMESERKVLSELQEDNEDVDNLNVAQEIILTPKGNVLSLSKQNDEVIEKTTQIKSMIGSTTQETNYMKRSNTDSIKGFHGRRHSLTSKNHIGVLYQTKEDKSPQQVSCECIHASSQKVSNRISVHAPVLTNTGTFSRESILERRSSKLDALAHTTDRRATNIVMLGPSEGKFIGDMNESRTILDSRKGIRTARHEDNRDCKAERLQDSGQRVIDSVDAVGKQNVPDTRDNIFYKGPHGAQGVSLDLIRTAAVIFPIRYGYSGQCIAYESVQVNDFFSKTPSNARQHWQVLKQKQLRTKHANSRSYALWKRMAKNAKFINSQKKSKWKTVRVNHVLQISEKGNTSKTQVVKVNEDRTYGKSGEMDRSLASMTSNIKLPPLLTDVGKKK